MNLFPLLLVVRRIRRGMGLRLRPVHTRKEIVDSTLLGVAAAVNSVVTLASVVNDYVGTVGTVEVGSKISSVYLFVQIIPATTGTANVDFYVIKRPAGVVNPTPGATGGAVGRNYILHEEKGIPGNAGDGASPLTFRGVIRLPRGRQRMAEGDLLQIVLRGADSYNACIKCIYKSVM